MEETNLDAIVFNIFNAPALDKIKVVKNTENFSFVYYTSAETLFNIINNKEIWMRKASMMNDHAELEYGRNLVKYHLLGGIGNFLSKVISPYFPNFMDFLNSKYDYICNIIQFNTYLTCISEHLPNEHTLGRLSMWRAYAPENGIALVLNKTPFVRPVDDIGADIVPVNYLSDDALQLYLLSFIERISDNIHIISRLSSHDFNRKMIDALRYAICSVKHPGFHEEREYRIIYNPNWGRVGNFKADIKCLNGIPQLIYKIPLQKSARKPYPDTDLDSLISRIIVGPSKFSSEIARAFRNMLANENVQNAHKRVVVSDIPLRV